MSQGDLASVVAELRELIAELRATISELNESVAARNERIAELEKLLEASRRSGKRQSAPFSKGQPSTDPAKPGRKSGEEHGRHGHRAQPVTRPDRELEAALPGCCPDCGGDVEVEREAEQFQVDLPPIVPIVTRFKIQIGHCRQCGRRVQGRHPDQVSDALGAAGSQVGPIATVPPCREWDRREIDVEDSGWGLSADTRRAPGDLIVGRVAYGDGERWPGSGGPSYGSGGDLDPARSLLYRDVFPDRRLREEQERQSGVDLGVQHRRKRLQDLGVANGLTFLEKLVNFRSRVGGEGGAQLDGCGGVELAVALSEEGHPRDGPGRDLK